MVAHTPRKAWKWRSLVFPACPLPPERQRYFDTFSRLYVLVVTANVAVMLPMFWLLGDLRLLAVTLASLGISLISRELHRRKYMDGGVCLLLATMTWHMLEAMHAFGSGVGFELYFAVILLILYISAMPQSVKALITLPILALTALQLIVLRHQAPEWPHSPLTQDLLLVANLSLVSLLFGVILSGLEGVTERLERNYRREATHDALTGIYNRRAVLKAAEQTLRSDRPFALLMVDIDFFKRINDDHGHELGDRALCHLVECLRIGLRDEDVLGRYGGEEFIVVLKDMTLNDAMGVAERLAEMVREHPYAAQDTQKPPLHLTVSMGVAVSSEARSLDTLIALADRRLYCAKRGGRDRVVGQGLELDEPSREKSMFGMPQKEDPKRPLLPRTG